MLFFIHIPKCGGNGILNIFNNLGYDINDICGAQCINSNHKKNTKENYELTNKGTSLCAINDIICKNAVDKINKNNNVINALIHHVFPRQINNNDIIFSSIRNPYDLLVSRYCYHNKYSSNKYSFEEWINNFAGEYQMRFIECCYENGDITNKMIVQHFIKIENIEDNINELINKNILHTQHNPEEIKHYCSLSINTTNHKDYTKYYKNNQHLKDKVYEANKLIFDMFGYEK
jgi:hypothetical protein